MVERAAIIATSEVVCSSGCIEVEHQVSLAWQRLCPARRSRPIPRERRGSVSPAPRAHSFSAHLSTDAENEVADLDDSETLAALGI